MWFFRAPAAVFGLAALSLLPSIAAKPYPLPTGQPESLQNATQIEKRQCPEANICGWERKLCCEDGDSCYVDKNNQAACGRPIGASPVPTAQPTSGCSQWQNPCGSTCCESGYWCINPGAGTCQIVGGSSGGIIGTLSPSAPLRPTSSTLIIVTATGSPTATRPFGTPIPTGVNGTLVPQEGGGGGGLSGGAIAGIVIGVILGLLLLLMICFFCCAKSLFDAILACFGIGKKRKHTHEETYIEEHHHSSGGAAAGGWGRRWHGQGGPARPNRPAKSGGKFGNMLGVGAGLGALALALGMKRKHDRRDEKSNTSYTGSSAYYSDYTSTSSASSDRRSRPTRHSSRR